MNHLAVGKSSLPEVLFKKGALKSSAKITGNNLCQSFFFNNVARKKLGYPLDIL